MMIPGFSGLTLVQHGGFADVFVGMHIASGQRLAVKVLRDAHVERARENFAREVLILSRRASRYLLNVLAADLDAPKPYYVMPFMPGGCLTTRAGSLSEIDVLGFGSQIASAVAALHAIDIVHGDLKPDNALLAYNELRVGDPLGNGGGCTVSLTTKQGGTPGYMAPELRHCPISPEADVYAFGATLFHLTTGVHPYRQPDLDPARFRPRVDPVLRAMVRAATHTEPSRRPAMIQLQHRLVDRHAQLAAQADANRKATGGAALLGLAVIGAIALASAR